MVRIAKFGRISKILKLTRLIRMVKMLKKQNNIFKHASEFFQISNGFQRIFFFIFSSVLVCHIFSCLWIFFTTVAPEDQSTWNADFEGMSNHELYLTSFYFIITTFSTVGYGDMSATNPIEKIFCIIIMCVGVTAFASGTSELTNLLQTYDQQNARLHEKVIILNRIYRDYSLPLQLYENVKKSLH